MRYVGHKTHHCWFRWEREKKVLSSHRRTTNLSLVRHLAAASPRFFLTTTEARASGCVNLQATTVQFLQSTAPRTVDWFLHACPRYLTRREAVGVCAAAFTRQSGLVVIVHMQWQDNVSSSHCFLSKTRTPWHFALSLLLYLPSIFMMNANPGYLGVPEKFAGIECWKPELSWVNRDVWKPYNFSLTFYLILLFL